MTSPNSPKTPKADYTMMERGKHLNTQPSLPINGKQHSQDMWEPTSARSTDFISDLQSVPPPSKESCLPSPLRKLARAWLVLRWQLTRNLFSVPLPFLTSLFDVKLGDLLITLPICIVFLVTTAIQAKDREVVFILTVRNNSVLLALTGISYERVLFYHKLAAFVTIILSGLHGLAYILAYDKGEISGEGDMVFTGTVAFGAMVLMFVFSLGFVRRRFFEFFLRTHWILFIVVLVFAVMHGASTALIGVVPWGIDMVFRHAYRPRVYAHGSIVCGKQSSPQDSTDKSMGVIARDQVSISTLPEWHPFTIASSPHESMVTLYIKALGDWTNKLQALVAASQVTSPFDILVDGPYGSGSIDIKTPTTYSHFALFFGGIGVTPMRSIVNWLHYEVHHEGRSNVERVQFVWSVRDLEMVQGLVVDEANGFGDYRGENYFPHGIVGNRDGVFCREVYLSRSERDVEAADLDRHLESSLRYGVRPDITTTLRAIGEQAKQNGKKRVAVLVCGPRSMVNDVINKSLSLSWEIKVRFDVHSEVFEF
ncbi:Ferric reductase NAD binding domain [Phytophthora infestans]|uniref:Ferric reductase NAD binding domain n=1 Tax=Phytophthora infestans TaxID=4787 RepID=A0A8S9UVI4_PHYIN|nr:Ferric reductase NAD binding domain [Phytophthora infestans]